MIDSRTARSDGVIMVHFVSFVQFVHATSGSPPAPSPADDQPMHSPIRIETVADLIARKHTLGLYCRHCDRWAEAQLERLAARGMADRPILRLNFRCIRCGTSAQRQLRPPALPPARAAGWMEPLAPTARVHGATEQYPPTTAQHSVEQYRGTLK
jgi:hypothetical protein